MITGDSDVSVAVETLADATQLTTDFTSCALLTVGDVDCWGAPDVGDGAEAERDVPVAVNGL